jgi:hypothetical protein
MKGTLLIIILCLPVLVALGQRPRLIVTTDIGQDPDDQQSMVRLLHYANEFQIEGIIANADVNYDREPPVVRDDIIHKMIDAYDSIFENLRTHDAQYPEARRLHDVVKKGCYQNGVSIPYSDYVGEGKDTEGSNWIIQVVDQPDPAPIHISVWGGACDLAQALWKVRSTRSPSDVTSFVRKLRVFFIGKQDSSNDWIIENFRNLWLILALDRGGDKWESGYRGMFWGGDMKLTSKEWIHGYIIGRNPLANMYPDKAHTGGVTRNPNMAMKEGDSPAFLYFLKNGLNSLEHPSWGGWGGRYINDYSHVYGDANDTYYDEQAGGEINSPRATVFRWRPDFQHDFATRVTWGYLPYNEANHHPVLSVNGSGSREPLEVELVAGKKMLFDAGDSSDPDDDEIIFSWIYYREAGTFDGKVTLVPGSGSKCWVSVPPSAKGATVHIILCAGDRRALSLTSYRRILIAVK